MSRMVVRGRGSSWKLGLVGTLGFSLVTVVICLFVNAQPDSSTYIIAHTNTLGAVVCSVWLVGALVISYRAGLASGQLGGGGVAGLVMGGLSGLTYALITNILSPYWYGSPIAYGPVPLFFSIFCRWNDIKHHRDSDWRASRTAWWNHCHHNQQESIRELSLSAAVFA